MRKVIALASNPNFLQTQFIESNNQIKARSYSSDANLSEDLIYNTGIATGVGSFFFGGLGAFLGSLLGHAVTDTNKPHKLPEFSDGAIAGMLGSLPASLALIFIPMFKYSVLALAFHLPAIAFAPIFFPFFAAAVGYNLLAGLGGGLGSVLVKHLNKNKHL